ncbi:MAG: tRNA uridine-5-carboxymethylaminomethyl(34) synthesis GTPase MnmE [Defluviitaleaceae bacterium]|nr:tRNA uridine-5-carboxymethylaminomethyl(34) synthesis GTPase MnmE [Defluviitaleaceae bacterium]
MTKLDKFNLYDTIVGVAAPTGGSISIIRMSGSDALDILGQVFVCKEAEFESHRVYYGWIVEDGKRVDEVLATVMLAPRTFTRQNVVEINCHGGALVTQKVLSLLIAQGARLAEAGEFTKRAFLAGRIDLSCAEAVMDIIQAGSDLAHKAAISQLSGRLSGLLDTCTDNLLNQLARIEMAIDYPDHEEAEILSADIKAGLEEVLSQIDRLLSTASQGRVIREGIKTAIVGRPNAGKSSLLNALVGHQRAIVTHVAGTTRDVLRETIDIGGVFLTLSDTAGIRHTDDIVEAEGVARSQQEAESADLVLLVVDGSDSALHQLEDAENWRNVITVVNKCDLPQKTHIADAVQVSAKNHEGIEELKIKIKEIFAINKIEYEQEIVTNARHVVLLQNARVSLVAAIDAANVDEFVDMVAIDIQSTLVALGEITGATVDEDLINKIFSEFCLGK